MADQLVELHREVERRAAKYAPPAPFEPVTAGITGGAGAGLVLAVFTGGAGLNPDAVVIPTVLTIALFGFGPWFYFKKQQDRYYEAVVREYAELRGQELTP